MNGFKQYSVIPGLSLSLGYTLFYLGLIVLLPMAALVSKTMTLSWSQFWDVVSHPQVVASYQLTFGTAFVAALINLLFGSLVAWVLVRYSFRGKRIVDALIDLPFALPTAVAGIALVAIYGPNGPIGAPLLQAGIKVAYTPLGITLALIFIGFPFVVRTVQPILEDFEQELEEAAAALGANRWYTVRHVILPHLFPSLLTGFALAFARGVGEYGSVIFIAGNLPFVSEITPLLIVTKLEQFDYPGATAIACAMLSFSLVMLFVINSLQSWLERRDKKHQGVMA
ncbi:sulfate ABC transporter permease subunit CysT [Photobacterium ganghwense]|uniref:Sulfate transport system permease protein CysT n=1 Tax=Photobacterium ganghwense TaxID=320778 RepID=A0A0J1HG74_9GAMM|nr:sulfate ABC transporter permease subunit CysT [Photobacterium ganghwense]KLV10569.1 sulfate transporter [Photobacterium ganghwense]PSU09526.1 sulfate ABC transporter permease subunit CysT [Photobacterium ganghwense]